MEPRPVDRRFRRYPGAVANPSRAFAPAPKCSWDDRYFYVKPPRTLEEPDVWATLTEHDSVIFRDNDFEVFLNPSGDTLNYFEFEMNALNTGWDLFPGISRIAMVARPTTVGTSPAC